MCAPYLQVRQTGDEGSHSSAGDGCAVQTQLQQLLQTAQGRQPHVCHLGVTERQPLQSGDRSISIRVLFINAHCNKTFLQRKENQAFFFIGQGVTPCFLVFGS